MNDFPSKELLEVIRGQARLEEKIDYFLSAQLAIRSDLDAVKSDIHDIKSKRAIERAYIAGIASAISAASVLLISYVKSKLGL